MPYVGPMRISPKYDVAGGVGDLWTELKRPQPYRWPILFASCALTGLGLYPFFKERVYPPPPKPDIVYLTTFAPDRTDAEIIASNVENQERKDARQRLLDAQIEKRREMYRGPGDGHRYRQDGSRDRRREGTRRGGGEGADRAGHRRSGQRQRR